MTLKEHFDRIVSQLPASDGAVLHAYLHEVETRSTQRREALAQALTFVVFLTLFFVFFVKLDACANDMTVSSEKSRADKAESILAERDKENKRLEQENLILREMCIK